MDVSLRNDEVNKDYKFIGGIKCQHGKDLIDCVECIEICKEQVCDLKCQHQREVFMCALCYHLFVYKDQMYTEFLPYLVYHCREDPSMVDVLKENQPPLYNSVIEKYPDLIKKQEPSEPSVFIPKVKETPKETDPEKNVTKPITNKLGLEIKFKFSASCKCQHNLEVVQCKKCNPVNLEELKNIKCLHLIYILDCNHCKNLILILRKEKEKTRTKFITDKDYIPFIEYDKLYLNPKQKKITTHPNKKRKTDPELDKSASKDKNQENKSQGDGNKKENMETETTTGNNSKRNFKLLESQEDIEPEKSDELEQNLKDEKANTARKSPSISESLEPEEKLELEKIDNRTNTKKPPPIFITNEELESIKQLLIGYEIKRYTLKETFKKQIKLTLTTEADYRKMLQKLHDMDVKFYTFQFPSCKTVKRILRGLPVDYDMEKIKSNFKEISTDLEIMNIRKIHHIVSKTPLPLFEISFKSQSKISEKLEKIKKMDNLEISLEKLNPKYMEIPICKLCLNYGHTKRFCSMGITCIVCTGQHFSSECPISLKAKEENRKATPKCLHCEEPHFTTWKGCGYYKKLRKAKMDKYKQQRELKNDEQSGTPSNPNLLNLLNSPDDKKIKKLNNQIKNLEQKFEKEITLLNKTIALLRNEISNLNGKLAKCGNTQKETK